MKKVGGRGVPGLYTKPWKEETINVVFREMFSSVAGRGFNNSRVRDFAFLPPNNFKDSTNHSQGGLFVRAVFQLSTKVQTPAAFDPFAEANAESSGAGSKDYVHIRVQQRNGRKSLTTVQGLKKEFSYNKILKDLKKEFCCNGTVVQDPELGQVIQLQGDQRKNVSTFLVQAGIVKKEHIKIHGF
nr:protein translation factor SUI1 homolog [Ipomoea trifida]